MTETAVTRSIHVLANRTTVWQALTTPELIDEWFGDDALAITSTDPDNRVGYDWKRDSGVTEVSVSVEESHHGSDVTATLDERDAEDWSEKLAELEAFLDRQDSI